MVKQRPATYDPNAHYGVDVHEAVYFDDGDISLPITVFQPKGEGPFPALLRVHGGAWNVGKREAAASIDRRLAEAGMVIAAKPTQRRV